MSLPAIVMVHGGQHTGKCWDPTVAALKARQPDIQTIAIDLPGHGDEPGDLATLTIAQCEDSTIRQINDAGADKVILVGHSMAGVTLPGVATKLGADRVARMMFLACCIPPQGKRVLDTLHPPMNVVAGFAARFSKVSKPMPRALALWTFANGMTPAQKEEVAAGLTAESVSVTLEPVDRSGLPDTIARDWILPLQDRALTADLQRQFVENLGHVEQVFELDACHNAMMSHPEQVADIILSRVA